jgi:hypothetical protein
LCYLIFDISKNKQKTECHDYFHIKLGANWLKRNLWFTFSIDRM